MIRHQRASKVYISAFDYWKEKKERYGPGRRKQQNWKKLGDRRQAWLLKHKFYHGKVAGDA